MTCFTTLAKDLQNDKVDLLDIVELVKTQEDFNNAYNALQQEDDGGGKMPILFLEHIYLIDEEFYNIYCATEIGMDGESAQEIFYMLLWGDESEFDEAREAVKTSLQDGELDVDLVMEKLTEGFEDAFIDEEDIDLDDLREHLESLENFRLPTWVS